jgi:hypothetical protein
VQQILALLLAEFAFLALQWLLREVVFPRLR